MTTDQLANTPVELKIDGVDGGENPIALTLLLCRSLPTAAAVALDRDLIAIGKQSMTPYHRVQPQLKAMAAMVKEAVAAKDMDTAAMIDADRTTILRKLTEDIESNLGDQLTAEACYREGRASVAGLIREIADRTKHAGNPVKPAELSAIVTPGNASLVLASLQIALGEIDCPTAAT